MLALLVTSWNFSVFGLFAKPKIPWALNCTVLPGDIVVIAAGALVTIGVQIGVGVGVGVWPLVGVGLGVGVGGAPRQTFIPRMVLGVATTVELLELPPQLMISAAARNDSTGTSTRHLRRHIIKH